MRVEKDNQRWNWDMTRGTGSYIAYEVNGLNWKKQEKYLRPVVLIAALMGKLWLSAGAGQLEQWIMGDGHDPVSVACAVFEDAVAQGGGLEDGLAAFCDGISGDGAEH